MWAGTGRNGGIIEERERGFESWPGWVYLRIVPAVSLVNHG